MDVTEELKFLYKFKKNWGGSGWGLGLGERGGVRGSGWI